MYLQRRNGVRGGEERRKGNQDDGNADDDADRQISAECIESKAQAARK